MASSKVADEIFASLKLKMSKWFDKHRCVRMLKVLYRDHVIDTSALHKCSNTMKIIELLIGAGHLTSTNLTLLYETIKLTQQFGLEKKIQDLSNSSFRVPKDIKKIVITQFTPHRQRLVNLGMALSPDEILQISGLYNVDEEHAADSWSLIMDLEQRLIICEGQMETFIKNLRENDFPKAVKALTEEQPKKIQTADEDEDDEHEEDKYDDDVNDSKDEDEEDNKDTRVTTHLFVPSFMVKHGLFITIIILVSVILSQKDFPKMPTSFYHYVLKETPTPVSKAFQEFQETSTALEKSANHSIKILQDALDDVIQKAADLKQNKDKTLRDIETHMTEMVEKIKKNGKKIKNEVDKIYSKEQEVFDVRKEELQKTISDIDTKLNSVHQLLKSDEATALKSSEREITALKERINGLPKIEPHSKRQFKFIINKEQIATLQNSNIGNLKYWAAADCCTLKGEKSVSQGQTFVVKILKTNEYEINANQLKATWTHPTGETNITQVKEDDNGDYFVTGKFKSPGVCKLDVSADGEPIRQSPMKIKVEKEGLVNTIQINQTTIDILKYEGDCLLVSCHTNKILKYKQSGEYIGTVTLPKGVRVDRMHKMKNGDIAFSDWGECIKVCNMSGHVIKSMGHGELQNPHGIHVDEALNVVYVANCGLLYGLLSFDINSGQTISKMRSFGQNGKKSNVFDVTFTYQGHLLLLDFGNSRLQLCDKEGKFLKVFVEAGDENGKVRHPHGVVVDEDENIIISSEHKIQVFSSDGNFIKRIDKPEDGINNPQGLSIISHHPRRLAVANSGDKTVKIFNY